MHEASSHMVGTVVLRAWCMRTRVVRVCVVLLSVRLLGVSPTRCVGVPRAHDARCSPTRLRPLVQHSTIKCVTRDLVPDFLRWQPVWRHARSPALTDGEERSRTEGNRTGAMPLVVPLACVSPYSKGACSWLSGIYLYYLNGRWRIGSDVTSTATAAYVLTTSPTPVGIPGWIATDGNGGASAVSNSVTVEGDCSSSTLTHPPPPQQG
jgi:hypothetical protein